MSPTNHPRNRVTRVLSATLGTVLATTALVLAAPSTSALSTTQEIGIPAYWSPRTTEGMEMFERLAQNVPTLGLLIINGPTSSPPVPFDPPTAEAVAMLHDAGVTVLGYVDTGYLGTTGHTTTRVNPGSTAITDWKAQMQLDVDDWYALYGSYGIDGIFFDQTVSACGPSDVYVNHYGDLHSYITQTYPGAFVAINPGTSAEECYVNVADSIMIFENKYPVYQGWTPPSWVTNYPPEQFWHLVYDVPTTADMQDVVALSKQRHAGYVYVTDDQLTNPWGPPFNFPWDTIPPDPYWNAQLLAAADVTDTTPPGAPGNLHPTSTGCGPSNCTVSLAWDRATDNVAVVGYQVSRNGGLVDTVYGTKATITGGMSPQTTYTFSVRAVDAADNLGPATSIQVTTPAADLQPPTAPSNLQLTDLVGASVSLAWTASTDNVGVTGYDVYQNTTLINSVSDTSATVLIEGPTTPASSYVYTVRARDAAGNQSAPSNELLATVPPPTSGPIHSYSACMDADNAGYVATFSQTFDYRRVFLNTDNDTGTGYPLPFGNPGMDYMVENAALYQYAGGGGWNWTQVAGVNPLVSEVGGTLTWEVPVSALDNPATVHTLVFQAAGTSPEAYSEPVTMSRTSGSACVTPSSDTEPPTAPTNLHTTTVTGTSVTLAWDASTDNVGVTGYDGYQNSTLVQSVPGSSLSATVSGQTPASRHTYVVRARDAAGNTSDPSNALLVVNPAPTTGSIHSYSACHDATVARYAATYGAPFDYHRVFINSDNNTLTGYALPFGNPAGNDYLIENDGLYEYVGPGWNWQVVAGVNPLVSVDGDTYTWQVPRTALGSEAGTVQVVTFNAAGTSPETYTQLATVGQQTESC